MTCKNCGKDSPKGAFCIYCGSALLAVEEKPDNKPENKPKKRNAAALALGVLSVILAIALALSLTGALGTFGKAASKSFSTPEDAIKYFAERLEEGDFDGALSACAVHEMAEGFDYKAYSEFIWMLKSLGTTYLPSEYPLYVKYNESEISQQIMVQMIRFSVSFDFPEKYALMLNNSTLLLEDKKFPENLIEEFEPKALRGLELVEIGRPKDNNVIESISNWSAMFGADDAQTRLVLYKYNGDYYIGGFTVVEYDGRWLIQNMMDITTGGYGNHRLISDKSEFEDLLE